MKSYIVVNVQNRETRVGVVEDGRLAEVYVERSGQQSVGSIYKCKVKNVLGGMDAAFVDIGLEKNAFLYSGDILPYAVEPERRSRRQARNHSITGIVREGQEFLVQVVKAPRASKGARVSTKITLPGRYIVLLPESDSVGISKRISVPEHDRLKPLLEAIRPPGFGLIARTEAEGRTEEEISRDINTMVKVWNSITETAADSPAPSVIYQELSLIYKIIRDNFTSDTGCMYIDSESKYKKARELARALTPGLEGRIKLYSDRLPIFERFGLERDYQQMFKRKIWLRSGGYICIDIAEALTVIDVNTGKFVGNRSLTETVLTTNLQAASEIARQIRLRDLGGIIVVDFIDMISRNDRDRLIKAFQTALNKEHTKTSISQVTELGLVELNRKRVSETVGEALTEVCPYCSGRGRVESSETVSLRIERDIRGFLHKTEADAGLYIKANPRTALCLIGDGGKNVKELEELYKTSIYIRGDGIMHIEEYDLAHASRQKAADLESRVKPEEVFKVRPERCPSEEEDKAVCWVERLLVEIPHGSKYIGKTVNIKIKEVYRSHAVARIRTGRGTYV
ncbi:MAG: Rne/Rng family ribonuclease [Abditibacteriota bacterium]|nr:Rne/Rng family ribonuclease [Abditibacteriota bacterium]